MKRIPRPVRLIMFLALATSGFGGEGLMKIAEPKEPFDPGFYVCFRSPKALVIDGRLDDPGWKKADWTAAFRDIQGGRAPAPRHRTRVKMLWDQANLYLAAEIEEPDVWAAQRERDSAVFEDNDFEVFLDPDGDSHLYFELDINALNTVSDLLLVSPYRDGGPAVGGWDLRGLKTAVAVDGSLNDPKGKDKSWTVEMALPWVSLRDCVPGKKERPEPGNQWRVNFSRTEYRVAAQGGGYAKALEPSTGRPYVEDNWTWSPQGLIDIHYPEMWGYVQFSGKTAGKGKDLFADAFEEKVKWALRRIYYRERGYRQDHGSFAADLDTLGLGGDPEASPDGWEFPPRISVTDSLFETVFRNRDGESWHIRQDGLVWKEEMEKP